MIQLLIGISIAMMAVGFFLFAELSLRIGEIVMWVGMALLIVIIAMSIIRGGA